MRLLAAVIAAVTVSCSPAARPDCDDLGMRCHHAAEGPNATATQRECHEKAHEGWSNAECITRKASCEAVCPDTHHHDAG